jgi:predicted lipid-binding transport protein (Tim44 family)
MKRVLMMALVLLISVAFVTTVFAQAKPEAKQVDKPAAAPEKTPTPEKKVEKKEATKPAEKKEAMKTFKGEFVSMDAAAKTIAAKDAKGEITFDIAGVKKMAELKAGQKIMVRYTEKDSKMLAKIVVKQAAKNEAPKKEEAKPAPAKTEVPNPAEPAKK